MVVHACNPSYLGGWGTKIAWSWKAEVAVSWGHTTALQPGQQSETLSRKKPQKKTKTKKNTKNLSSHLLPCIGQAGRNCQETRNHWRDKEFLSHHMVERKESCSWQPSDPQQGSATWHFTEHMYCFYMEKTIVITILLWKKTKRSLHRGISKKI